MATYTGEDIIDLSVTTPTESATPPDEVNDAIREIKRVLKNQNASIVKSSAYTLTSADSVILVSGTTTITVPASTDVSSSAFVKTYIIIKTDASTTLTIARSGSDTFNGATSISMTKQYEAAIIIGSGVADWKYLPINDLIAGTDYLTPTGDGSGLTGISITGCGDYKNLVIANNGSNPNYQLNITADAIQMVNSSNALLLTTSYSKTVDITVSGANGLDTGSEAISTWYHIWAIGKTDGTVNSLLSVSATAPTMPSGYTYKLYLGAIYNDSSSNFVVISQQDNKVNTIINSVLSVTTSVTSYASVSVLAAAPVNAKRVFGTLRIANAAGGGNPELYVAVTSTGLGEIQFSPNFVIAGEQHYVPFMSSAKNGEIYYKTNNSVIDVTIYLSGWEF